MVSAQLPRFSACVYGTICRSVLKRTEVLLPRDALLAEQGDIVLRPGRHQYKVEAIYRALEDCHPPGSTLGNMPACDVFVGYLMLDAIVGNTDRP